MHFLVFQQSLFFLHPALCRVAAKPAACSHHAVARDERRKRVDGKRIAHCARGVRFSYPLRKLGIGDCFPAGNARAFQKHALLEGSERGKDGSSGEGDFQKAFAPA